MRAFCKDNRGYVMAYMVILLLTVGLPMLILAIIWCYADAEVRDYRIGKITRLGLVMFFIIAFLIYVFRTRGLRGFKTLGLTALFVAAMAACFFAAGLLTVYIRHFAGFI